MRNALVGAVLALAVGGCGGESSPAASSPAAPLTAEDRVALEHLRRALVAPGQWPEPIQDTIPADAVGRLRAMSQQLLTLCEILNSAVRKMEYGEKQAPESVAMPMAGLRVALQSGDVARALASAEEAYKAVQAHEAANK